jgi:hypothetical protein
MRLAMYTRMHVRIVPCLCIMKRCAAGCGRCWSEVGPAGRDRHDSNCKALPTKCSSPKVRTAIPKKQSQGIDPWTSEVVGSSPALTLFLKWLWLPRFLCSSMFTNIEIPTMHFKGRFKKEDISSEVSLQHFLCLPVSRIHFKEFGWSPISRSNVCKHLNADQPFQGI